MYSYILQIVGELFILLCYILKIEHYRNKKEKMKVFWIKFTLFFLTVVSAFAYTSDEYLPLHNMIFVMFLAAHK